ncbi:hypothetical protein P43SY_007939 [Pythium insidiosum]|uniref:CMP/dCMP-type deaminase domain-containing protein n=1 Tax=Pythium insidiosum TaxID=114742 RepID=A0AAD5MEN5_PYTIN|nr:hypothetical protein P43SY_007939 [Pythium insidiosum]
MTKSSVAGVVEIVALADDHAEPDDAQQRFLALSFPAKHGAAAIKHLTATCGSLADLGFPHLKRMKRDSAAPQRLLALVLPLPDGADESDTDILSEDARASLVTQFEGHLGVVDVLKRGPKTREAWEAHTKEWPLIFHASVAAEQQDEVITEEESMTMKDLARLAKELAAREPENRADSCCALGCLVVDPAAPLECRVVADSEQQQSSNEVFRPIFHAVMKALDGVARRDRERESAKHPRREGECEAARGTSRPGRGEESYLCTGYDVYLDTEPCAMCAMALVHSRARRVVFATLNASNGALASAHRLHTIKSLNHRYRVFHAQLCSQDEEKS